MYKKNNNKKKRGDREGMPRNTKTPNATHNATPTEQQTHCKHMGQQRMH